MEAEVAGYPHPVVSRRHSITITKQESNRRVILQLRKGCKGQRGINDTG